MIIILGIKNIVLRKKAWLTVAIVIANILSYNLFYNSRNILETQHTFITEDYIKNFTSIFSNYCLNKTENPDLCEVFSEQFSNLQSTNYYSQVYDIGEFSKIYFKFEHDLKNNDPLFQNFPSYKKFKLEEQKFRSKTYQFYREKKVLSKHSIGWESLLIAQFKHGSYSHIFFNLLVIFILGLTLEQFLPRILLLSFYLLSGGIALGLEAFWHMPDNMILIGASGNAFAFFGLFYVYFFSREMKTLLILPYYLGTFYCSVKLFLPLFVLLGQFVAIITNAGGGVAYQAHVYGFLAGAGFGLITKKYVQKQVLQIESQDLNKILNLAMELVSQGRLLESVIQFDQYIILTKSHQNKQKVLTYCQDIINVHLKVEQNPKIKDQLVKRIRSLELLKILNTNSSELRDVS